MGLVVANADFDLSVNDWLNLGFVKIAGQKGFYVCERTNKNPYGPAGFFSSVLCRSPFPVVSSLASVFRPRERHNPRLLYVGMEKMAKTAKP